MATRPVLQLVPQTEPSLEPLTALMAEDEEVSRHRPWFWVVVAVLSVLIHLLLSFLHVGGGSGERRYEVQTVDPAKLEAVRRAWREQKLLMSRDTSPSDHAPAPPDARYMSDRNRTVERETRARLKDTSVLARPGSPTSSSPSKTTEAQKPTRSLPKLSDLGTPFRFSDIKARPENRSAQPEGGAQYVDDPNAAEGDQNVLNTQESVYYSFYARLYDQIGPIWQSNVRSIMYRQRLNSGEYITQVDVVLTQGGALKEVRVMHSSGVPELDHVVGESWARIGNFPNPPRGLINEQGEVHTGWTFHVHVEEGYGFQSAPPQRNY